jgi:hypothetical protein
VSPLLNLSKLRGIRDLVVKIKSSQQFKASGAGQQPKNVRPEDLTNMNIGDILM